ncbi:TPA: hypothetical protein ACVTGJ_002854 [Listeria monocytogenes]|uniref:hypothetical protein n=1 Tax=Listeria monocytogenes TaxID=1639 RepID=UPI0015A29EB7|nr:hypothetical protein [Listeria monocytogenes]EJB6196000.1 hypothetical protein [Listeria monocytogenes]MBK3695728.1 hypothetical protein [Listeria monocytogenes]NVR85844.1 hypothetical protein [Listeria monocytogenes]HEM1487099.1 hypothetical protein [Listeria monocytogenes]
MIKRIKDLNHLKSTENELIFDIKRNRWVNMKMYEDGISTVTDDIYYFENDKEVEE